MWFLHTGSFPRVLRVGKGSIKSPTEPAPSSLAKRVPRSQQNNRVQLNLSLQIDPKNN